MLLVLDDYLEIKDLDKYKKNKIKLITNGWKRGVIILVYYIP